MRATPRFAFVLGEIAETSADFDAAGPFLLASENEFRVSGEAVQALGHETYTKDWPVERYLRDAKLLDIGEETNEIRRMLIGRALIGAAQ